MPPLFYFGAETVSKLNYQSLANTEGNDYVDAYERGKDAVFIANGSTNSLFIMYADGRTKTANTPTSGFTCATLGNRIIISGNAGDTFYTDNDGDTWIATNNFGSATILVSNYVDVIFALFGSQTFRSVDGATWVNVSATFPMNSYGLGRQSGKFYNNKFYLVGLGSVNLNRVYELDKNGVLIQTKNYNLGGSITFGSYFNINGVDYCVTTNTLNLFNIYKVQAPSTLTLVTSFYGNKKTGGSNYVLNFLVNDGRFIVFRTIGAEYFSEGIFKPLTFDNNTSTLSTGTVCPAANLNGKVILFCRPQFKFYRELNR